MFLRIFIIIVILALLGGGGYYFWQSRNKTSTTTETTEVTPTQEMEEPTPTPEEVNKGDFTIEVQNGSGIAGEAGRAQKLLEDDEYTVKGTSNADNYDYTETVIQADSSVPDAWIDQLVSTLEKKYTVQTRIDDKSGSSDADVIVIVGKLDDSGDSMVTEEPTTAPKDNTPTPEESEDTPTTTPSPTPTP
jgi:hypothetical protein